MLTARVEAGATLPGRADNGVAPLPDVPNRSANEIGPAWAWAGDLSR